MCITMTADIKQNRVDMECNIPEIIWQGKINNNRRCMYEIVLWNPATGPQEKFIWNQTWSCPTTNQKWYIFPKRQSTRQQHTQIHHVCNQVPVKCRKKIQQHWKRGTRYTTQAQEVPLLLLCERGECNNRSQTTSSNFQERCSNAISENTMNSPQNTPVQSKNHIHNWTRSVHGRLALQTQPQGKQRQRNAWHVVECWCHTDNYKHARLHGNTTVTTGNLTRYLTYNSSKIISSDAGQRTGINYHKTCKHTGYFEMIWQWSLWLYSKADM